MWKPDLQGSPPGVIEQQHVNNTYFPLHDFAVVDGAQSETGITVCAACGEGKIGASFTYFLTPLWMGMFIAAR